MSKHQIANDQNNLTTIPAYDPAQQKKAFHLYPNPASNFIYFESIEGSYGTQPLQILNLTDKQIKELNLDTPSYKVNISDLESGMYLVKVTGKTISHFKLIVS